MNRKKWALLFLVMVLALGYIKLFYKTYSNQRIAKTADNILALDVKRITNTVIWNYITTPSQWKIGNIFKKSESKELNWKDMVEIPDYVFAFHQAGQPANVWYCLLTIKNEKDFIAGMKQFSFEQTTTNQYINTAKNIHIYKNNSEILITNSIDSNHLLQVANEIFIKKEFVDKAILNTVIDAASHATIYFGKNSFLENDAIITANFDKEKISLESTILPKANYIFTDYNFSYIDTSLCSIGFTQLSPNFYNLLSDSSKSKVSKLLNVNIDSVLLPSNKYYQLNVEGIRQRIDSAISYEYDDNFNSIEKVVVNKVEEPSFQFLINGNGAASVYNYLKNSNTIQETPSGKYFSPIPFVKSYCTQKDSALLITSNNFTSIATNKNNNCIFYANFLLSKLPESYFKYFSDDVKKITKNLESINVSVIKKQQNINVSITINKKNNIEPIFNF